MNNTNLYHFIFANVFSFLYEVNNTIYSRIYWGLEKATIFQESFVVDISEEIVNDLKEIFK